MTGPSRCGLFLNYGCHQVHDCFSIAEMLMYEAIGLAPHGKGADVAKNGITHIDGKLPINTGGGLIAFGHPVGATGVKQLHEVYRQMKGQCGDYQVRSGSHANNNDYNGSQMSYVK